MHPILLAASVAIHGFFEVPMDSLCFICAGLRGCITSILVLKEAKVNKTNSILISHSCHGYSL